MNVTAKHAPTPWHVSPEGFIDSETDRIAAVFHGFKAENAAFIVRACNSHDKLVEALRDALSMLIVTSFHFGPANMGPADATSTIERIKAALATAGEPT